MVIVEGSEANKTGHSSKPTLDKRRSNIVDEAFLEQKEILLDMLESKLKEVRDKKKKKTIDGKHLDALERDKCESMLKNVDVNVKINGISAVGEADLKLKYGNSSKGFININSTGISNVGQANIELGVGESAVFIPGLSNIFIDRKLLDCVNKRATTIIAKAKSDDTKKIEDNNKNEMDAQVDIRPDASTVPLSEIITTTASKIVDIVIPTASTLSSIVNQPPPAIFPPALFGDIVPRANQLPIVKGMPQEIPQANPQQAQPQALPQAYPQAVPPNGEFCYVPSMVLNPKYAQPKSLIFTRTMRTAAAAAAAAAEALGGSGGGRRMPPPLLRSRTLPAIIAPGFSILHAQIDPQRTNGE
ncbi:unnamed protein product [Arctia plantaginis]|uniref:Uncharacterized protein n=1 Tax=Arctia plantaginis TaxID=874455 RepID=A0A8S0ZB66_ARCPL|nr:unnamed protein product [Arctia plantaginis]